MSEQNPILIYMTTMVVIWLIYSGLRFRKNQRYAMIREHAIANQLTEPASLHPVINTNRCTGCQSCVYACPERQDGIVLGMIGGKAELVNPTACIGHGACAAVCPVDAITLVFGTAQRGVDIPHIKPNFETNVPGILVAGELGGMGLIKNAFNQGMQAIDSIKTIIPKCNAKADFDVLIVGAGPAGLAASLAAKLAGLKFVTVEQDTLGGSIRHYPRNKIITTVPSELPIVGRLDLNVASKSALLEMLNQIVDKAGLKIAFHERVKHIEPEAGSRIGFSVKTNKTHYSTRTVLLAIGRRGTPRQVGVPGEDKSKVTYQLIDPEQYRGKHILVVSGGDSALEAAVSLSREPGTTVTLSYRSSSFSRAREINRKNLLEAEANGRIKVYLKSKLKSIHDDFVTLDIHGKKLDIPNDAVIICAGGELPSPFLRKIGVDMQTMYGIPLHG